MENKKTAATMDIFGLSMPRRAIEPIRQSERAIGRLDFFWTDGKIHDSVEYSDPVRFEADIRKENYYGTPMIVVLYADENGETIPHDFLRELDPSFKLKIERVCRFSAEQETRIDEVHNSVYSCILALTGKTPEEMPFDMGVVGPVSDHLTELLASEYGLRIRFPAVVSDGDKERIEDYVNEETPADDPEKPFAVTLVRLRSEGITTEAYTDQYYSLLDQDSSVDDRVFRAQLLRAVHQFMETPEGHKAWEDTCHDFNWNDVFTSVPESILNANGIYSELPDGLCMKPEMRSWIVNGDEVIGFDAKEE